MSIYEQLRGICDGLYQYPDRRAELSDHDKDRAAQWGFLHDLESMAAIIDDDRIALHVWRLRNNGRNPMTPELLINEYESLKRELMLVIGRHKFAYIPARVAGYFEQDYLFGKWVYDHFPQMRDDIREAGNAIAADLPTAAVFYLMRVAEAGFRLAAKRARVRITNHKGKKIPIDFATWEKIIQGLNTVSNTIAALPKSPAREAKKQRCADLSDQCSYFRDIWRDKTMHSRKRFDLYEAESAFMRVRQFIENLAGEPK